MSSPSHGFRIVLTADRTLMADYKVLLDGMVAAAQTTSVPSLIMKTILAPPLKPHPPQPSPAPMGLRRIEAALLANGFSRTDVAIVPPARLKDAIGPATRIVGISSGDPLGRGMNSTTMRGLARGRTYTQLFFDRLVRRVRSLCPPGSNTKLVVGGPGAWQLAADPAARTRLHVDHVVLGYCENEIPDVFSRICDGRPVPEVIESPATLTLPPTILAPALMGVVEITRGCGLGCGFCTMSDLPMLHFPVESVLADARVNLQGGLRELSLIGEDIFRYGAASARSANPEALKQLLSALRTIPGLGRIHVDHANVASVARFSDRDLAEVASLLAGGGDTRYLWVNLGVETASPGLLAANCPAKLLPHPAQDWPELCYQQVRRLADAGFVPMVSLLMGLPGETQHDVAETLRWVRRLGGMRVTVFPMFLAPLDPNGKPFTPADMSSAHWQLLRESYRLNFKWLPRLVWDNQRSAPVPLWRSLALQALGRAAIPVVRLLLAAKCAGRKK